MKLPLIAYNFPVTLESIELFDIWKDATRSERRILSHMFDVGWVRHFSS